MKSTVCLLLCVLMLSHLVGANTYVDEAKFDHIAVEAGLSNYNAGTISQDSLGYLWIATSRGLNRFDGEAFQHFLFDPDAPEQGLPNDLVLDVECVHNHVFVRTTRGVVVYNQKTDRWHKIASNRSIVDFGKYDGQVYFIFNSSVYYYDFELAELFKASHFEVGKAFRILDSDDDYFWMADEAFKTLYAYNKDLEQCKAIDVSNYFFIQKPVIFNGYLIGKQRMGVFLYKIVGNRLVRRVSRALRPLNDCKISRFLALNDSLLAIATMGDGLFLYQIEEKQLDHLHSNDGVSSLNSDFIKSLFLDDEDNLWVSTFDRGLNVDYNEHNKFKPSRSINLKTDDNFINCIVNNSYRDELLFGSRKRGIISDKQTDLEHINELLREHGMETVVSLFEDSESKLWIGGINDLFIYDQKKHKLQSLASSRHFKSMGNISESQGAIYMTSETEGISVFSLQGEYLYTIAQDVFGVNELIHQTPTQSYFCSIRSGVYSLNCQTREHKRLELTQDGQLFDWEGAVTIELQNDSILWIGTLSWGLIKVNLNTLACISYTKNDGLPGNDVTAIEIDDNGHLWLSTSDGLSCMHGDGQFSNFSAAEGVDNYQFHRRSSLKTRDGQIFFGGNSGLTYFDPKAIDVAQKLKGKVVLESISSRGKQIRPRDESEILTMNLPYTQALNLAYNYSNFSIKYTIPHLFAHEQITYAYKLDGFDQEWHESLGSQSIYYTNLPAGDYTFLVKASRQAKVWTEETRLSIKLDRAPWFRWWALLIYFIVIVAIIVLIFMLTFSRKVATANWINEQKEHQRENEINEMKHRFFTNISHELRTPLTIINAISNISPDELDTKERVVYFLRNLHLNIERLKRMVDQLLTFRNLDRDTLHLDICKHDVNAVVQRVVEPFNLFTEQKNITFSTQCALAQQHYAVDRDKIEKVLNNLLDNAIKYTPRGGQVQLEVDELPLMLAKEQGWRIAEDADEQIAFYLSFKVCDSGIGIDEEALAHIFDRYYKASSNVDYSGTGIGLNFVKQLIDLYEGDIKAESKLGEGTCFTFILPVAKNASLVSTHDAQCEDDTIVANDHIEFVKVDIPEVHHGKTLLVVEDDVALNNLLCKAYEQNFKVFSAYDSHEGMILAKNKYPDLIISDVMMGEVDEGLKFCAAIKKDAHLSHIPVVLLTARAEKSQIVEGYAYGADAYVTKPFDVQILTSNIVSLLANRERLQKDILAAALPKKEETQKYNQNDIVFVKKINEVISEQYKNPKFNIASLSKELLISRSAFYNKFTHVTKLSPNDYLRKYRINKAIELINEERYSITQIVEMVGFNSRSGFYSSFKKELNMTPTEYIKKNRS